MAKDDSTYTEMVRGLLAVIAFVAVAAFLVGSIVAGFAIIVGFVAETIFWPGSLENGDRNLWAELWLGLKLIAVPVAAIASAFLFAGLADRRVERRRRELAEFDETDRP